MKGYRFYEEYNSPSAKRKKEPSGNVVATYGESYIRNGAIYHEGVSGVLMTPNSPVNYGDINHEYLRKLCRRISEAKARVIHPELFSRLDHDEARSI